MWSELEFCALWSGSAAFPRGDLGSLCIPGPSGCLLAMDEPRCRMEIGLLSILTAVSAAGSGKQQPARREDKGNWEGIKEHLLDGCCSLHFPQTVR